MGLVMFLNRVPEVDSIEELTKINERLDNAFVEGKLMEVLKEVRDEKKYIYNIDFSVCPYMDIEKWKEDKKGWGNIIELNTRVAYWRKFNALHLWFVENVQDGIDECQEHIVTIEHLKKLKEDLDKVNKENVENILPTQEGFFFGGTEYDDYYWESIEHLKSTVDYLINQHCTDTTYVYCSSW